MLDIATLLKNLFSATAMRIISSLLSFLLISYLARVWDVAQLGQFSTLFSIFLFLFQIPLLGLHIVLIRDIAANPEKKQSYTTTALALSLFVSLFLALSVILIGQSIYPESMHSAITLIAVSNLLFAITAVIESVLIAQEKMPVVVWGTIIENLFRVACGFALAYSGFGITPIVACFVIGRLLALIVYQYLANVWSYVDIKSISINTFQLFVRKIPTVFIILLLSTVIGRFDFILLSILGSMRDVGLYSPAFKIYEMGLMVPSMLTVVIYPTLARFFDSDRAVFDQLYTHLVRFIIILGTPALTLVAYFSADIIALFFGQEYLSSHIALKLLLGALLLITVDQILIAITYAAKRDDLELKVLAISSIIYLSLLFLLIPKIGFMGAAIATLTAAITKLFVRYLLIAGKLHLPSLPKTLLGPILATIVMLLLLAWSPVSNVFINAIAATVSYSIILILTRGITRQDFQYVKSIATK
ncbi:MAG: oligosaccharide flippase family protein [Arenicella sp.]